MREKLTINENGQWLLKSDDLSDWMVHNDFAGRDVAKKMTGDVRDKALKHLSDSTQSRTNKDGEKEYLLHRGVGEQEAWSHGDNDIDERTSWTPHYHVAHKFSKQYNSTDPSDVHKEHTLSAWVPEKHIASIPMHAHADEDFSANLYDEHEVVVDPHKFQYADSATRDKYHTESKKKGLL